MFALDVTRQDRLLARGAALWLLAALLLAWCLVGLGFGVSAVKALFPGNFHRVLQAHIDFLLMTALILGIRATKTPLPPLVPWAMVIGAFTNSSLFLLMGLFPQLDPLAPAAAQSHSGLASLYEPYLFLSLIITSFGFGRAAVAVLKSTLHSGA